MLKLDPIWSADIQQIHFRQLLEAMSRPGSLHIIHQLPEVGTAALTVLATLLDSEVSLSDPENILDDTDRTLLQVKQADSDEADYILCNGNKVINVNPKLGTLPSPEQSATLILTVDSLTTGNTHLILSGPGIKTNTSLKIDGLAEQWLTLRNDWVCHFPLGVDLILVDDKQLISIPRTTHIEVK